MQLVTMLATVVVFPVLCLGFLLWMAAIEDSLPEAVRKAERQPDPPPILAIPVPPRTEEPAVVPPAAVHLPTQRAGSAEVVETPATASGAA